MERKYEEKTYSQLYKIVENNMISSGGEMGFTEEAYLLTVNEEEGVADILRVHECKVQSFLEYMYIQLLGRIPDDQAKLRWKRTEGTAAEIKPQIIKTIVNSNEFLLKDSCIKNNIYEREAVEKSKGSERIIQLLIRFLKPLARRLPEGMKVKIKRFLRIV